MRCENASFHEYYVDAPKRDRIFDARQAGRDHIYDMRNAFFRSDLPFYCQAQSLPPAPR
jgi:hypothetical protein